MYRTKRAVSRTLTLKVTKYFAGVLSEKNRISIVFMRKCHKLYINRKVMNYEIRKLYMSTSLAVRFLTLKKPENSRFHSNEFIGYRAQVILKYFTMSISKRQSLRVSRVFLNSSWLSLVVKDADRDDSQSEGSAYHLHLIKIATDQPAISSSANPRWLQKRTRHHFTTYSKWRPSK